MLRELQAEMRAALLGGDPAAVIGALAGDPASAPARFAVHRDTVTASLIKALEAAYPVVRRLVGARCFSGLARRFVQASPPAAPQLWAYGDGFADALAADPQLAEKWPFVAEVARLEWVRVAASFAADGPRLDPSTLAAVPADRLASLGFVLHPTVRLVVSMAPILTLWLAHQEDRVEWSSISLNAAESVLVLRRADGRLAMEVLGPGEAALVGAFAAGLPFGDAAGTAVAVDPLVALDAGLGRLFTLGALAAVRSR